MLRPFPIYQHYLRLQFQLTIHLFNLLDLYTILSSLYPELTFPTRIHRVLIPKSNSATLELTLPLVAGSVLIYAATLLRVTCYRMLGQHFTYELAILKGHKLVTTGPYEWVRHPSYSGIILFMVGIAFTHLGEGSWWVECGLEKTIFGKFMLVAWTATTFGGVALSVSRVKKEDKILRNEFKGEWEAWRERTPYALIPFFY